MASVVQDISAEAMLFYPTEIPEVRHCSIGMSLHAARRAKNLSINAVVNLTRIRAPYIEALEAGHLESFTASIYAVGFARSYARALGLDPEWAERKIREYIADYPILWRKSGWAH